MKSKMIIPILTLIPVNMLLTLVSLQASRADAAACESFVLTRLLK
jgi:hypothetical protein